MRNSILVMFLVCWSYVIKAQSGADTNNGWRGDVRIELLGDIGIPTSSAINGREYRSVYNGTMNIKGQVSFSPWIRITYFTNNLKKGKSPFRLSHALRISSQSQNETIEYSGELSRSIIWDPGPSPALAHNESGFISRSNWSASFAFEEGLHYGLSLTSVQIGLSLRVYAGLRYYYWSKLKGLYNGESFNENNSSAAVYVSSLTNNTDFGQHLIYGATTSISFLPKSLKGFGIIINLPLIDNRFFVQDVEWEEPRHHPGFSSYNIGVGVFYSINPK